MGQLQRALEGFVPQGHRQRADVNFLKTIVPDAIDQVVDPRAAELLRDGWEDVTNRVGEDSSARTVVHADFAPENIVVSGTGVAKRMTLIDFDDAYFGSGLVDIATPALDLGMSEDFEVQPERVIALMKGLQETGGALPTFELVDHMWLNAYRYFAYTVELNLQAGKDPAQNKYSMCVIRNFADQRRREGLIDAIETGLRDG